MTSTIYDIRLRYMMEDRASRGVRELNRELRTGAKEVDQFAGGLKRAALAAGAFFGIRAGKKALIDYNNQMEQARVTTAGLLHSTTGASWEKSLGAANAIVADLEQRAKTSTATTAEMVTMMREIVQPATMAGLAAKDLSEFTAQAVVAARAFGDEEIAALDIQQALMGTLTTRDRFAKKLLATIKMTTEEFNALGAAERTATLQKAFRGPAIARMATESANTFAGVFSTFQDQVQIFFGQVGLPLFKALTAEIAGWNRWIEANKDAMVVMAAKLSKAAQQIFGALKGVAGFFVEHSNTLILLAKVWAGVKLGRLAGGLLGGGAGQAGGFLQKMGGGLLATGFDKTGVRVASFGATMLNAAGTMGRFIPWIGLAAGALKGVVDWWNREDPSKAKARMDTQAAIARSAPVNDELRRLTEQQRAYEPSREGTKLYRLEQAIRGERIEALKTEQQAADAALFKFAQEKQLLNSDLLVNPDIAGKPAGVLTDFAEEMGVTANEAQTLSLAFDQLNKRIQGGLFDPQSILNAKAEDAMALPIAEPLDSVSGKPKVNVTIQRIEVRSDDPDRFAFGLVESLRDYAKNPSQGRATVREG